MPTKVAVVKRHRRADQGASGSTPSSEEEAVVAEAAASTPAPAPAVVAPPEPVNSLRKI